MRRVPAGGEEGIGVHGENRRAPASGAGGSVEAPTVPGARGQSLERRPPLPLPPTPSPPAPASLWTEWEEPGSVTPTETEPFHSSSPCTTPQGVTDVPATRDSGQRARAPTQSSSRGPGVTGRSGTTGHSGRGSCRARGAWAGGGAARLDELRSSVRGPRKAARRFGTRTPAARRGAGRTGRAAGDAYLAQRCPRYRNP